MARHTRCGTPYAAGEGGLLVTVRRLCMVVHARYPTGEPRIQRQSAAALEAGWEVDVVSLRHDEERAHELVEGVRVHRLPVGHDRTAGALRMAGEYLVFAALATAYVARLHIRRPFAVVHVSNPPDLLVLAGLLPRLLGARVILDVHDLTPDLFEWRFGDAPGRALVARALRLQERVSVRGASSLMTVHDGCARVLAERSARPGQEIAIVMNSFDERLLPAASASRAWHDPLRLVYHGSLTQLYGVHTLVDAIGRFGLAERVRLSILGEGDERPKLEEQISALGLGAVVELSGRFVPIRDALALVAECDVGVVPLVGLPINRFSLPSKLLEYVALGLPVVCGRTETVARHFAEDELFFFRPGDTADLARTLSAVVDDPERAKAYARRARARYDRYRWERSKERFLELIEGGRTRRTTARG